MPSGGCWVPEMTHLYNGIGNRHGSVQRCCESTRLHCTSSLIWNGSSCTVGTTCFIRCLQQALLHPITGSGVQTTEADCNSDWQDHMPCCANVVKKKTRYLAVCLWVPVNAVGHPEVDVAPHLIVQIDNIEAIITGRPAGEVVREQNVVS